MGILPGVPFLSGCGHSLRKGQHQIQVVQNCSCLRVAEAAFSVLRTYDGTASLRYRPDAISASCIARWKLMLF
jgi:hypothetical protein